MKTNLSDTTFLILIRLDSIPRLENILVVTEQICKYFNTTILVREADSYNKGLLKSLLNRTIHYEFIEDKDPVLYKTKHFNQMTRIISTQYIAIWDADIVVNFESVMDCIAKLRKNEADVAYPYNGICYDIPNQIKCFFLKKRDIRFLFRHKNKMDRLYPNLLVGGAVLINREKYIQAGKENEMHYGWGNDDFDRYYRFLILGYAIYKTDTCLFHLSHPRSTNSQYRTSLHIKRSSCELIKLKNSSINDSII